jgi:hypothetical protein
VSRAAGIKRRASSLNQPRLDDVLAAHPAAHNLVLHYGAHARACPFVRPSAVNAR